MAAGTHGDRDLLLPGEHERYLEAFLGLRLLKLTLWYLEQRDHPAFPDWETEVREGLATLIGGGTGEIGMSPATSAVMRGKPQIDMNSSTTKGVTTPESRM